MTVDNPYRAPAPIESVDSEHVPADRRRRRSSLLPVVTGTVLGGGIAGVLFVNQIYDTTYMVGLGAEVQTVILRWIGMVCAAAVAGGILGKGLAILMSSKAPAKRDPHAQPRF